MGRERFSKMIDFNLNEEIRCGFMVDTNRKKVWAVQLDLLDRLLYVCKTYNIKCFAYGGTLLGAVRHKGFIPWDDDIDMALTRTEYDKLCEVASYEFKEPYFFQNALTDSNYFLGMSRLRNTQTTGIIKGFDNHKYNNGIALDIYVYDTLPDSKCALDCLLLKLKIYETLLNNYYHFNSNTRKMRPFRHVLKCTKRFIDYDKLYLKYHNTCCSYATSKSERLGFLCNPFFLKYDVYLHEINEIINLPFENIEIPVPIHYDSILNRAYGDYMKFPPVEERGKWHDGMVILDPDIPFYSYYLENCEKYRNTIAEYKGDSL